MRKYIFILMMALLAGCSSNSNKYVEGTMTQIGAYLPISGEIYGMEVVNYMNGVKATCCSNQTLAVTRSHCASNSYFGIVHTVESTTTEVKIK